MNNEHLAAQSDIKNPRELKPPGGEAGENASHDPETNAPSHSDSASPKKIFVCSPYCESGGKRKFCSRNCYYESRYGLKEGR